MNRVIVALDFDGVLNTMLNLWVERLNAAHNLHFTIDDIKYWDMSKTFTMLTPKQIYQPLYEKDFWYNVCPAFYAEKTIRTLLQHNFKVIIVTATDFSICDDKVHNCILKLFPQLQEKDIIICNDKSLIRCDYIIDDYEENLKDNEGYRILIDAPYNQYASTSKYDYRATDLCEATLKILSRSGVNNKER